MILLGCPEPPVLIPSFLYLVNLLKNKGYNVFVSANPAALKLIETADSEKYYINGVGFQNIEEGIKNKIDVDKIISFVHNDAGVHYTITYKMVYNTETISLVFGRTINEEYIKELEEEGIKTYSARAFHNPTPIVVKLKKIVNNINCK